MTRKRKIIWSVAGGVVLVVAGWFVYPWQVQFAIKPVKIGYVGPLSGDASGFGYSVQKALELAKRDLNASYIEIIPVDSRCQKDKSVKAVTELLAQNVVAIIGDICSGATVAIVPLVEKAGIPLISPASTSPALSGISLNFFRTIPSDDLQGKFAAEMLAKRGYKNIMVFYTDEPYGKGFFEVLQRDFGVGGNRVTGVSIKENQLTFTSALEQIRRIKPEAMYIISNSPTISAALIKQVREAKLTTMIYGAEGLKDKAVLANAGTEAIEGLIVSSVSTGTEGFISLYKSEYDMVPGPYAAQAYDAFRVVDMALAKQRKTNQPLSEIIPTISFKGMSGQIVFDAAHNVTGVYDLWQVQKGEFIPAP